MNSLGITDRFLYKGHFYAFDWLKSNYMARWGLFSYYFMTNGVELTSEVDSIYSFSVLVQIGGPRRQCKWGRLSLCWNNRYSIKELIIKGSANNLAHSEKEKNPVVSSLWPKDLHGNRIIPMQLKEGNTAEILPFNHVLVWLKLHWDGVRRQKLQKLHLYPANYEFNCMRRFSNKVKLNWIWTERC